MTNSFPSPVPDYSAAHSMDAQWFAVDADGYVAEFHSGESGAVPKEAPLDCAGEEFVESIESSRETESPTLDWDTTVSELRSTTKHFELKVHTLQYRPQEPTWRKLAISLGFLASRPLQTRVVYPSLFLLVSSWEPFEDDRRADQCQFMETTQGPGVYYPSMTPEKYQAIHDADWCLTCVGNPLFLFDESYYSLAFRGCYYFDHNVGENLTAGPYSRLLIPKNPIHIDELSPAAIESALTIRFDNIRFADEPWIQPVEHLPCEAWGSDYLDTRKKTIRAIPGKETEYVKDFKEICEGLGTVYHVMPIDDRDDPQP